METQSYIWRQVSNIDVFEPELSCREVFLRNLLPVSLDPNTVHRNLLWSEDNTKVTYTMEEQPYSDHPDRFSGSSLVLSTESLSGMLLGGGTSANAVSIMDTFFVTTARTLVSMHLCPPEWGMYLDQSKGLLFFNAVCGIVELIPTV